MLLRLERIRREINKFIGIVLVVLLISFSVALGFIIFIWNLEVSDGISFIGNSTYFRPGPKFEILGVDFDNQGKFTAFAVFFAMVSFLYHLNMTLINPLFQRLVYDPKMKVEKQTRRFLATLLIFYDVWIAFRNVISVIGLTSNFYFFIAGTVGFLVGDLFIRLMIILNSEFFVFNYSKDAVSSLGETKEIGPAIIPSEVNPNDSLTEEESLLKKDRF